MSSSHGTSASAAEVLQTALKEVWIHALGFPAVLPPPEEVRQVETAIGASRAGQARDSMLEGRH